MLDLRLKGHKFKTHWRHCIVSLSKTLYPLLVQSRKTENHRDMILKKNVDWEVKHYHKQVNSSETHGIVP